MINEVIKYDGPFPYIDGLILRASRNYSCVEVEHKKRLNGSSGYTIKKLVSLWLRMFTNFSIIPLRLAMYLGFFVAILSCIGAIFIFIEKLNNPNLPVGWASLIVSVLFLSSINLLAIGMLGEYLGRLFMNINKSPQYVIRNIVINGQLKSIK
jgi:undecaprenyl-phosphate 4-deoxy-4-formamido-L-arabinose transferase